jgi:hypothetical protein
MRLWEASPGWEGTHRSSTHTHNLHCFPTEHTCVIVIMAKSHAAMAPMLLLMAALLLAATSPAQAISQFADS